MNTYNKMASEYEQVIEDIKDNIKHPEKTQKDNILKAAKILEKNNHPLNKISAKIAQDLKSLVTPRYIRDVLDPKYKEVEKTTKELVEQQVEIGGKSVNERRDSNAEVVPHSNKGGKSADNKENEVDNNDRYIVVDGVRRKKTYEELRADEEKKKNYRAAMKFGDGGGSKWGRSLSGGGGGSSWVSTKEREESGIPSTNEDMYNDDMEELKAERKEFKNEIKKLKIENEELKEKNKNLMEQRVEVTYVTMVPAAYEDMTKMIAENPPKIFIGFDKHFLVNDIRLTEESEEYNKKRFVE